MSFKKTIIICAKIIFICVIAYPFFTNISENTLNGDENSYLRSTRYFKLFFLERNFGHSLWQNIRAYDQPPIAKYIFGAGLLVMGEAHMYPLLAQLKDWNYEEDYDWNVKHGRVAPHYVGYLVRYVGALFGFATCLLLYWIGACAFNREVGVIAALLLAYNPLMLLCSKRITANPIINFFLLVGLVAIFLYEKNYRQQKKNRMIVCAGAIGLFVALATATKLNGGIILICFTCFTVYAIVENVLLRIGSTEDKLEHIKRNNARLVKNFILVIVVGATFFVLPNPYLYNNPLEKTFHMVDYRMRRAQKQQQLPSSAHQAITTWDNKIRLGYKRCLLNDFIGLKDVKDVPVTAVLFFLGICMLLYSEVRYIKECHQSSPRVIIVIWTFCTIVGTLAWLPLDWHFYYLPMIPCVLLMVAHSMDCLCCFIIKKTKAIYQTLAY